MSHPSEKEYEINKQEKLSSQVEQEAKEEAFSLEEEQLEEVTGAGGCCSRPRTSSPPRTVSQPSTASSSPTASSPRIPPVGLPTIPENYSVHLGGYIRSLSGRHDIDPKDYNYEEL